MVRANGICVKSQTWIKAMNTLRQAQDEQMATAIAIYSLIQRQQAS